MKNIHVLPTNIPSELYINSDGVLSKSYDLWRGKSKHIYITSDEEIKEGDWFLTTKNTVCKCYKTDDKYVYSLEGGSSKNCKKIILTTDQDLIKDGVQAIDDEFLEWFVKNSSCEEVRVEQSEFYSKKDFIDDKTAITYSYKIIIPKEEPKKKHIVMIVGDKVNEEPKQETLEEVAKWQQEQILDFLYSEITERRDYSASKMCEKVIEFIEQFKKK